MEENIIYLIISLLAISCGKYNSVERAYIEQSCICAESFSNLILENKDKVAIMKNTREKGFWNPQYGDGQITDEFMSSMDRMGAEAGLCQNNINLAFYSKIPKFKNLEMFSNRELDQRLVEHCPRLKKAKNLLQKK